MTINKKNDHQKDPIPIKKGAKQTKTYPNFNHLYSKKGSHSFSSHSSNHNSFTPIVTQNIPTDLKINTSNDHYEREAEQIANAIIQDNVNESPVKPDVQSTQRPHAFTGTSAHPLIPSHLRKTQNQGSPIPAPARRQLENTFNTNFSPIRIHNDPKTTAISQLLGAEAFTFGNHIYFNKGQYQPQTRSGKHLLAHELTHTLQNLPNQLRLRRATSAERLFWLGFFQHPLPRRLLNHYMDDTGTPVTLSEQEMIDCNVEVDLRNSRNFVYELARLVQQGSGNAHMQFSAPHIARTNGTLGAFRINFDGWLVVESPRVWTFEGNMNFQDIYDFDPRPYGSSRRTYSGEFRVRVAHQNIPGRAFPVRSVIVPVRQSIEDTQAQWSPQRRQQELRYEWIRRQQMTLPAH